MCIRFASDRSSHQRRIPFNHRRRPTRTCIINNLFSLPPNPKRWRPTHGNEQEATAEEVARWKDAVVFFYKKVLFKKQDKVRC